MYLLHFINTIQCITACISTHNRNKKKNELAGKIKNCIFAVSINGVP